VLRPLDQLEGKPPPGRLHFIAVEGATDEWLHREDRARGIDETALARRVTDEQALEFASRPVRELAGILGLGKADWSCTWPSAVELAADVAERLEYDVGRAALCIEQVGVDRRNTRVFHALEHHRPGVVEYGPIRTTSS